MLRGLLWANVDVNCSCGKQQVYYVSPTFFGEGIDTTDVGPHQMWFAQFLKNGPRRWIPGTGNDRMLGLHPHLEESALTNGLTCSACGHLNPISHKCCSECGTPL